METLLVDECYWCEEQITRVTDLLRWVGEDDSVICIFHPANFDARAMTATGETAYHQSMEEVHDIIIAEHHRRKAVLAKEPLRAVSENVVRVAKNAQRTSIGAAKFIEPKSGTIRARIYSLISSANSRGRTDEELERFLGMKHQSVSAARRSLVLDGYIVDSGTTRKNETGLDCIVWISAKLRDNDMLFAEL